MTQRLDAALDSVPATSQRNVSLSMVSGSAFARVKGYRSWMEATRWDSSPVDLRATGADVLVFPSRKWLRGPKGAAVWALSERALRIMGAPDGTDVCAAAWTSDATWRAYEDARRFEVSEFNPGLRLALAAACRYASKLGLDRIAAQNRRVAERLRHSLQSSHGWHGCEEDGKNAVTGGSAMLTYPSPRAAPPPPNALRFFRSLDVNVSFLDMQHARWASQHDGREFLLRLTPHYMTPEAEIDRLMEAFERLLG